MAGGNASGSQPGPRSPWRRARPAREERWQRGGARTGTWSHRLGLCVTEASKGLDDRRRRLLAGVLLLRRPDIACPLPGWKREELERKTGSVSDKESCKLNKKIPTGKTPTIKANLPLFLHREVYWLDSGLHAGSHGLYCTLKIHVANRVNGLIQSLLNWTENLQQALLVLDQTQKKQVRSGQNVLGKIPLWVPISDCSQFTVIIEIKDAQLHTPAAMHALYAFSVAFPVMWIWQKTGIKCCQT